MAACIPSARQRSLVLVLAMLASAVTQQSSRVGISSAGQPAESDGQSDVLAMAARAEQAKVALPTRCRPAKNQQAAVVTLISSNEGYPAGALAISAALEVLDSKLLRIALVTSAVNAGTRELLRSAAWEVMEVEEAM